MLVGKPIFPCYIIENSLTSLAHTSLLIDRNNFKFRSETRRTVLSKFGEN